MKISPALLQQIYTHLEAGYPDEACGVMLGQDGIITEIASAGNQRADSARNRYLIDPREYQRIECDADRRGLQVLGIYHSHPDAAAQPSQFDLDNAWPELSYLIVSVTKGKAVESHCWRLNEHPRRFNPKLIEMA